MTKDERIAHYSDAFLNFFGSENVKQQIEQVIEAIDETQKGFNGDVIFIGNGGSLGELTHTAQDYLKVGKISTRIMDCPLLSCLANDYGWSQSLVEWLKVVYRKGSTLVCLSSSGESDNIIEAVKWVRSQQDSCVVTMTGFKKTNRLKQLGDINIHIPGNSYTLHELYSGLFLHIVLDEIVERRGGK